MKTIWYRVFEVTGLVYLPVVGVYVVYGAGRFALLGDFIFFAETLALLAFGLIIMVVLGTRFG